MVDENEVQGVVGGLVEKEEVKGEVVVSAHAIAYPETMVVEAFDADLAFSAVLSPVITSYIALPTLIPLWLLIA